MNDNEKKSKNDEVQMPPDDNIDVKTPMEVSPLNDNELSQSDRVATGEHESNKNEMKIVQNRSRVAEFFLGKGFYAVAVLCLVAIGVAVWTAIDSLPTPPINEGTLSSISNVTNSGNNKENETTNKNESKSSTESKKSSATSATSSKPLSQNSEIAPAAAPVASFFVMPVTGQIIKGFNDQHLQYSETYCDMRLHAALDVSAALGTQVTSAGEGIVKEIKNDPLLGTVITIDHGAGVMAKYCGLSEKVNVKIGDTVDSKTAVGVVGEIPSESVETSHLHLVITKDNKPVSPLALMGME